MAVGTESVALLRPLGFRVWGQDGSRSSGQFLGLGAQAFSRMIEVSYDAPYSQ